MANIGRRQLILGSSAFALCSGAARAQVSGKRPLLGWLAGLSQPATVLLVKKFMEGMGELGHTEGRNFSVQYRFADGYMDRLPKLSAELVELKPDVILAASTAQALAVKRVTSTIPIVVPALADAVALGLIASEARPNGNVTGIAPYVKGLPGKQLELAREIVPGATRIGLVDDVTDAKGAPQRQEIETAASKVGASVIPAEVRRPADIDLAFQKMASARVEVAIVLQTSMLLNERKLIASLGLERRLPTVYGYGQHVDAGGLISYGIDLPDCFHRAAYYVDKIFKGTQPGDIPVEFPTKLELAINLKTAKALGLTVSPYLLARADKVFE